MIRIKCKEEWKEYEYDGARTLQSFAEELQCEFSATIVLAYMNGKLCELTNKIVDKKKYRERYGTAPDKINVKTIVIFEP